MFKKTYLFTKILIIAFFLLSACPSSVISQACYNYSIDTLLMNITYNSTTKIIHELTGDIPCVVGGNTVTILTRAYNYPGNDVAAQYIYEKFVSYGLTASYWQFSSTGKNVVAKKLGTKYPNQQFIVCSHFDSYPWSARSIGADDNATGTCVVLEAARLLSALSFDYTLVFLANDEEERGLYGSDAYADTAFAHGDSIVAVINYDMIAYDANSDNQTKILTNNASVFYANTDKSVMLIYTPSLIPTVTISSSASSDHYSFWQKGFKAIWPFEFDSNPYVNSMQDTISRFNYKYFLSMTRAAVAMFATLGKDYLMDFEHTPLISTNDTAGRVATVVIKPHKPLATGSNSPKLFYKVNEGLYTSVSSFYNNLDTFKFIIPGQQGGATVSYYFAAQDNLAEMVGTFPLGGRGVNPPGTIPPKTLFTYSIIVGMTENRTPVKFELNQNYPNPFNPTTIINYQIPVQDFVRLSVFDILGREVAVLINEKQPAGNYNVEFDGKNLASGLYIYKIRSGEYTDTKKMLLIK